MKNTKKQKSEVKKAPASKCLCPYCDEEVAEVLPTICKPCGITLRYCAKCHTVAGKDVKLCPKCGEPLK